MFHYYTVEKNSSRNIWYYLLKEAGISFYQNHINSFEATISGVKSSHKEGSGFLIKYT